MTPRARTAPDPSLESADDGPPAAEEPQEPPTPAGLPESPDAAARAVQGFVSRLPRAGEPQADWDDDQRDTYPLTVHEAIAEVTRQVGVIAKDRRSQGPGENYNFRGIDDVLAALHPILGDVGLVILPGEVRDARFDTRATKSGGILNVTRLLVRYRLIGPDGTETFGEAWGEAGDSGDKATQKAHSQSYKSFTLQTFSIPTEQSAADEPDAVSEPARPFTAEERDRAATAWGAALDARSVEALAGVRHRALHLLDVPVLMADGQLIPLALLFDQRRAALDTPGEPR